MRQIKTKPIVAKFSIGDPPDGFLKWVQSLCDNELRFEIVVTDYKVSHVYVSEEDDGNWVALKDEKSFSIVGSSELIVRRMVYKPRVVNGKFIANFNEEK